MCRTNGPEIIFHPGCLGGRLAEKRGDLRGNAVAALLDYHEALRLSHRNEPQTPRRNVLQIGVRLRWTDIPVCNEQTRVIELAYDLQLLIDALKRRADPVWDRGPHFYVTREDSPGVDRLHGVSTWVGHLLSACDGQRTIREVVDYVWPQVPDLEESVREYALVELLRGIHAQELVAIHRPRLVGRRRSRDPAAAPSRPIAEAVPVGSKNSSNTVPACWNMNS